MTSYFGSKLRLVSTPRPVRGRSMMWPIEARTSKSLPRNFSMVFAFAGDSTITRFFAIVGSTLSFIRASSAPRALAVSPAWSRSMKSLPPGFTLNLVTSCQGVHQALQVVIQNACHRARHVRATQSGPALRHSMAHENDASPLSERRPEHTIPSEGIPWRGTDVGRRWEGWGRARGPMRRCGRYASKCLGLARVPIQVTHRVTRSEERRVGKE